MTESPKRTPSEFERVARELGCDESEESFERIFAQVVRPLRKPGEPSPPKIAPKKGAPRRALRKVSS